MSKNTAWWIMADLAIWMAGYVTVPVYPNLQASSVREILEHAGSKLVFVGKLDDWREATKGIPKSVFTVGTPLCEAPVALTWTKIAESVAPLADSPVYPSDTTATIIYTSGTTGMPKGAVHGFDAFAHTATSLQQRVGGDSNERALSYLPLAHVAERCLVEGFSLYLGSRIFFAESLDTFLNDLQRARPTFFFSVPRLWMKFQQGVFAKIPPKKLGRLLRIPILSSVIKRKILRGLGMECVRLAGTGAAALPPEVLSWYRSLGLGLLEGYGMTEQFAFATITVPDRVRVGYVGEPLRCCEVKLSETGEVLTRGPAHMKGYFRDPVRTSETLTPDGWLRTGDLGTIDEVGRLRIVGRVKEQFKSSKGKYVAPAPIEGKLGAFAGMEACIVLGDALPQPIALAMLPAGRWKELCDADARKQFSDALASHLANVNLQLDQHERLEFVVVVPDQWTIESGFITPTMKLKRTALESHYAGYIDRWAAQRSSVVWHEPSHGDIGGTEAKPSLERA